MYLIKIIKYKFGKIISKKPKLFLLIISLSLLLFIFFLSLLKLLFITQNNVSTIVLVKENKPKLFFDFFLETINIALSPSLSVEKDAPLGTFINIIAAICGLIFLGALIGMISNIIENKISDLKRGKSVVIEKNHSVFLGWSNKLKTAIKELSEANRSMTHSSIVILALKDKVFMEENLLPELPKWSTTDVICRSGDSSDYLDLKLVNASSAKSIVLLSTDDANSDSILLKRALALQRFENITCPIIIEVHSTDNSEAIKLMDKFTVIQPKNFIMRVIAQTIKDPGLSKLYYELLSFKGKEIYFWPPIPEKDDHSRNPIFEENFVGKTFREVIFNFSTSSLIGIVNNDKSNNKKEINILPDFSTIIKKNDQLILISEDDSTIGKLKNLFKPIDYNPQIQTNILSKKQETKYITLIGWNSWSHVLMEELNLQLEIGSQIDIIFSNKIQNQPDESFFSSYQNIKINLIPIKVINKESLSHVNWDKSNSIVILSYRDDFDIQEADAISLMAFTHVKYHRDLNKLNCNICCELLDPKNQKLIEGNRDDEFITGEELIAMYLVQLSENKYLKEVYTDLLDETGAEFYLRSAGNYINDFESEVYFGELVNEGLKRNEIVIGIQDRKSIDNLSSYKSILSPNKLTKFKLGPEDKLVVIAYN